MGFRKEHDYLGDVRVPDDAYWGAQTQRAVDNFPISGLKLDKDYIKSIVLIKKAAVISNMKIGLIEKNKANAIKKAADEILSGRLADQFVVDVFQAGAGTSTNMNVNEVITNRAIEILKGKKGDYSIIHPNDDVNMGQSTNDVIPTAIKLTSMTLSKKLIESLDTLIKILRIKAKEFNPVIKSGRTHLMDAAPIRLGAEFKAWADMIELDVRRIKEAAEKLRYINIGATAVGTGVNANPKYVKFTIDTLSLYSSIKLKQAHDLPEATESMTDIVELSSSLKSLSVDLIKISNDIRLMNSGPVTGLEEIILPAVQPGSSIMPGKVNPSVPEMVDMVCFQVIGNDEAITMAAQAGQFELNVMMPLIAYDIIYSLRILTNAVTVFAEKAIMKIKANSVRIHELVLKTPGVALALNPYIGYEKTAEVVKKAINEGKSIAQAAKDMKVLPPKKIDEILDLYKLA